MSTTRRKPRDPRTLQPGPLGHQPICAVLAERRMGLPQAAVDSGLHYLTVRDVALGYRPPQRSTAVILARTLGVEPDALFKGPPR